MALYLKRQEADENIMEADYADYQALLANTLTRAESLLNSLDKAAESIDLHMNAD